MRAARDPWASVAAPAGTAQPGPHRGEHETAGAQGAGTENGPAGGMLHRGADCGGCGIRTREGC